MLRWHIRCRSRSPTHSVVAAAELVDDEKSVLFSCCAFTNAALNSLASTKHNLSIISLITRSCTEALDLLSEFENRMANVCASGSPSLTSAAVFHTQLRSLPTFGCNFISGTTVNW